MLPLIFLLLNLTYVGVYGADILCYFPAPAISHQRFFQPIWRELSLRGHKVTVITPNPLKDARLTNLTELDVSWTVERMKNQSIENFFNASDGPITKYNFAMDFLSGVMDEQLLTPSVQELLKDEAKKFDLVVVEGFTTPIYGLGHRFKAPMVGVMSASPFLHSHYSVGNPSHPILYLDIMQHVSRIESFWDRLGSTYHHVMMYYNHYYYRNPKDQELANKHFGDDTPNLDDLEKNVSLVIISENHVTSNSRPLVPAMVQVHSLHVKPTNPLPEDLRDVLDDAKEGFVYFSLGSNVKSVGLDDWQKEVIKAALSELPYKVLWKWEADVMEDQPKNVVIRGWLPQQDVLSHPNIKAFVTQGGLQSAEEAISRAVPLVVIPFLGDQPLNAYKLYQAGIAIELDRTTLTKEKLRDAIIEVATDERYKKRAEEVRDVVYDEPMKSLDKAMWWIEYVIRHKGARHLRSPALDIPTYQYFLLDVIGFVLAVILLCVYLLYKLISASAVFRHHHKSGKVKKN